MKKLAFTSALALALGQTSAQLSFTYTLMPNERLAGYFFVWSVAGSPAGSEPGYLLWAAPSPAAPWLLEVSPDSFTTQSCKDIKVVRTEIQAPAQNNFYQEANLKDLAAPPSSDLTLTLLVNASPLPDTTINLSAATGQELALDFLVRLELPLATVLGCTGQTNYSPPDSLQKHRFWSPANGTWINFTSDTLEVGPRDTLYKQVKFKSAVAGTFTTYFNRYREYKAKPVRTKIVFKVNTVATAEAGSKAAFLSAPFPNPAGDEVAFTVRSEQAETWHLEWYNWSGQLVGTDIFSNVGNGEQVLHCSVAHLKTGTYTCRMIGQRNGAAQQRQVAVLR